jgi:hypothetical protein
LNEVSEALQWKTKQMLKFSLLTNESLIEYVPRNKLTSSNGGEGTAYGNASLWAFVMESLLWINIVESRKSPISNKVPGTLYVILQSLEVYM